MSSYRNRLAAGIVFLTSTSAALAASGPSAKEVVDKCKTVMTSAKTYQGTWQVSMAMGQMGSMAITVDMKAISASGKVNLKVTPIGAATGMMAAAGGSLNTQVIDDGKTLYRYDKTNNKYSKEPHRANNSFNPAEIWFRQAANSDYKLEKTVKLNGRPTYVIQVLSKQSNMPGSPTTYIYIDQGNYQFKQLNMSGSFPAGQGRPPQAMNMKMAVKNDLLNAPIPDSVFKFMPPAGAKEVQAAQMPMPMGGPMMGGGMGRPR